MKSRKGLMCIIQKVCKSLERGKRQGRVYKEERGNEESKRGKRQRRVYNEEIGNEESTKKKEATKSLKEERGNKESRKRWPAKSIDSSCWQAASMQASHILAAAGIIQNIPIYYRMGI